MEILFKDIVATGKGKFASSQDLEQEKRIEVDEGIDTPSYEDIDVEELDLQGLETSPSLQRQKRKRDGKNNKRGVGSRMCDQFDRVIESLNSDNAITANTNVNIPTIVDCLNMLKHLSGLEFGSDTHILGIRLMKSKTNIKIFLALDDPTLRLDWIKSHNLDELSRH